MSTVTLSDGTIVYVVDGIVYRSLDDALEALRPRD